MWPSVKDEVSDSYPWNVSAAGLVGGKGAERGLGRGDTFRLGTLSSEWGEYSKFQGRC